jgi:hypothetical protein
MVMEKKMRGTVFFLALGFLLLCGCDIHSVDSSDTYPTTISPLPPAELQKLMEEYRAQNNFQPCMILNNYGFAEWSSCPEREILRVQLTEADAARMHHLARSFLLKNKKFTGVTDTSTIVVRQSGGMSGCLRCDGSEGDIVFIGWRVVLANQVYRSLEVKDTGIFVWMDAEEITNVAGNWFRYIYIPEQDKVDVETARHSLVGMKIRWSDFGGREQIFTVTEQSIGEAARKVILTHKNNQSIELRVAWEISISDRLWHVYVDTTTGETVRVEQLFMT